MCMDNTADPYRVPEPAGLVEACGDHRPDRRRHLDIHHDGNV